MELAGRIAFTAGIAVGAVALMLWVVPMGSTILGLDHWNSTPASS